MKRSRSCSGRSRPRRVGRSRGLKWRVTDQVWRPLARILVDPPRNPDRPGRPRYTPRQCLEGILFVLYTDTPWLELPYRELGLPSGETCRRRLEEWSRTGAFARALVLLQKRLREVDKLDWSRLIVDASLVEAKGGARRSRARSRASGEAVFI